MRAFSHYKDDDIFWFRIFGYGLTFRDSTKGRLLFSDRNRLGTHVIIGKWIVRPLKPIKLQKYQPPREQHN